MKNEGSIFFIPLFLSSDFKDNVKSYARFQFSNAEIYAFGRLIEIDQSGGDLVEIFNYIGNIPETKDVIINEERLINPIHISLAFSKKRWRFIFEDNDYDKNIDSGYQDISFLLGTPENPKLWKGGIISGISEYNTNAFDEWIIYTPTKIESIIKYKFHIS